METAGAAAFEADEHLATIAYMDRLAKAVRHDQPLAAANGVVKRFGNVVAVRDAAVSFTAGVVHAVCGENGAGKSTLLKILAGMIEPDSGRVELFGSPLSPHTSREASRRGVSMVLQHFALVPVFTALENVILGAEPHSRFGTVTMAQARRQAEEIANELGIRLPFDAPVESLGMGEKQQLEIVRALYRNAKLLILDEPTAVATKSESTALYAMLRRLANSGTGIVVVTHKMDEVRTHADIVTVLRRGEVVFTKPLDRGHDIDVQMSEITSAIMGTASKKAARAERVPFVASSAPKALSVSDLSLGPWTTHATFSVGAGEIVGLAGVDGNGQRELVARLASARDTENSKIRGGPIAFVRGDRQSEGLVLDAPVRDNLVLGELEKFAGRFGLLNLDALEREASARLSRTGVDTDLDRPARTLSGGNQQKIVVERALSRLGQGGARVLVAAHPTRGLDLTATSQIHDRLHRAAVAGAGILVLSADLDELRELCSRILVLSRGEIVADLPRETSDEEFGRWMLGLKHGVQP